MFKKIVACFLAVLMLMGAVSAFAESFTIVPVILPELDMTASEFYSSDSRVLFTTAVLIEVILSENEEAQEVAAEALIADRVFVGKQDDILSVFFWGDNSVLMVLYQPSTNKMVGEAVPMSSRITTSSAQSGMSSMKSNGNLQSYYQVDGDAVISLLSSLVEE